MLVDAVLIPQTAILFKIMKMKLVFTSRYFEVAVIGCLWHVTLEKGRSSLGEFHVVSLTSGEEQIHNVNKEQYRGR